MDNEELDKYYEAYLDLFAMPAWKDFMRQNEEILQGLANIETVQSEQELFRRQGEIKQVKWLIGWEALVRRTQQEHEVNKPSIAV